jgi:hypothetical protein
MKIADKTKTTFHLEDGDSALVIDKKGRVVFVPPQKEGEYPNAFQYMTTIACLLEEKDKSFFEYLTKEWEKVLEKNGKDRGEEENRK